jgi:hypothetical protein
MVKSAAAATGDEAKIKTSDNPLPIVAGVVAFMMTISARP